MANGVDPNDIYHNGGWYNRNGTGPSANLIPASYTWATKPSAASNVGTVILVTDVGAGTGGAGGGNLFIATPSRWKPAGGNITLDSVDTANSAVANTTEQQLNPNHIVIPAGLIGTFDRLRLWVAVSKSGTVDTATIQIKFGPLGTTADPAIASFALATTNQTDGVLLEFKKTSATSLQKQGNASGDQSYSGPNANAYPAAVTVSNMDSNPMYLSITSTMTTGAEVCTLQDYTLELFPTDSA
jgi:hypothetical protein